MKVFYRISDKSYPKIKLPGATKKFCLQNFRDCFRRDEIIIVADNVDVDTVDFIQGLGIQHHLICEGNAGSLLYAIGQATVLWDDDEIVYFVEDDYLHHHRAGEVMKEGLFVADYWTAYDHPDKYMTQYGHGEDCRVTRTPATHWRTSISTTMTFASTVKALKEDYDIWEYYLKGRQHPPDHEIFCALGTRAIPKKLAVAIPGLACHTDLTFSGASGMDMIDEWAILLLADHLRSKVINNIDTTESVRCFVASLSHDIDFGRKKPTFATLAQLSILAS